MTVVHGRQLLSGEGCISRRGDTGVRFDAFEGEKCNTVRGVIIPCEERATIRGVIGDRSVIGRVRYVA